MKFEIRPEAVDGRSNPSGEHTPTNQRGISWPGLRGAQDEARARRSRAFSRRLWTLLTTLGWWLGWTIGWRLLGVLPEAPLMEFIFWAVPGLVAGLLVGVAQFAAFPPGRRDPLWLLWMPVAMAWGAGGGLVLLTLVTDALRGGDLAQATQVPLWVIGFALLVILGLPAGAVIQWALIRLRQSFPLREASLIGLGWSAGQLAIWVGYLWSVTVVEQFRLGPGVGFAALWLAGLVGGAAHALGTVDPLTRAFQEGPTGTGWESRPVRVDLEARLRP